MLDVIAPLFLPADRPERFGKAAASGADAVILDLEDAVAPEDKATARNNLRTDFTALPVFVRVNAVHPLSRGRCRGRGTCRRERHHRPQG